MGSIFKREIKSYFTSPLGYVFIAVSFFASGALFFLTALAQGSTDLSILYDMMFFILIIMIPILCMRSMSDDKRHKTDQLLLTSPITLFELVLGKFFAAYAVFIIATGVIPFYSVTMSPYAEISWKLVFGHWLGLILIGGVYISLGILISALTESQMVAAIVGVIFNIVLLMFNSFIYAIPLGFINDLAASLSVYDRYAEFTLGFFSLTGIVFFLSLIFVFLFITVQIVERRRWA